jgi:hypothetical protein
LCYSTISATCREFILGGASAEDSSEQGEEEEGGAGGGAAHTEEEDKVRAEAEDRGKGRFAVMLMLRFLLSSVFGLAHSPSKNALEAVPPPKVPEFLKDVKVGGTGLIKVWTKSWGLKDISYALKGRLGTFCMLQLMQWVMREVEAGRALLHSNSTAKQWAADRQYLLTGNAGASGDPSEGAVNLYKDETWDRVLAIPTTPPHDPVDSRRFMMRCPTLFIPKGIVELVCTEKQKKAARATAGSFVLVDDARLAKKRAAGETLGKTISKGRKKHQGAAGAVAAAAEDEHGEAEGDDGAPAQGAPVDGGVDLAAAAAAAAAAAVVAAAVVPVAAAVGPVAAAVGPVAAASEAANAAEVQGGGAVAAAASAAPARAATGKGGRKRGRGQ